MDAARKKVERLIAEEEYEQALNLLSELSIQDPALEALILIKSEEYERALTKGITSFEAAYCHYRLGNYEKALKELASNEPRALFLKGQIFYRTGKYQDALNAYSLALKSISKGDECRKNVIVNYWACKAALAWSTDNTPSDNSNEFVEECNAYEVMYNRGIELLAQDREDALLLFKAAAGIQQRDGEPVDPAVQYNFDLCTESSSNASDPISILNNAVRKTHLNKAVKILKKEIAKRKLPIFQKQLVVEQLIVRAVEEKKFHTAYNLSKMIEEHQRIQPYLNFAIKKCRSLKKIPITTASASMTMAELEKLIHQ